MHKKKQKFFIIFLIRRYFIETVAIGAPMVSR